MHLRTHFLKDPEEPVFASFPCPGTRVTEVPPLPFYVLKVSATAVSFLRTAPPAGPPRPKLTHTQASNYATVVRKALPEQFVVPVVVEQLFFRLCQGVGLRLFPSD